MSGIFQLVLDLLADLTGKRDHALVLDDLGLDHDAYLTACLNGVAVVNTREGGSDLLQLLETLDVIFDVLASCAGTRCGKSVGCLHQDRRDGLCLHIAVVRVDRVDDRVALLVFSGEINTDLDVRSLDLVVDRLADVVQQTGALCQGGVDTQLARHHAGEICHLDRMVEHVLTVAGAVAQSAQQLDKLGMDVVDTQLQYRVLALALDGRVDLTTRFFDRLFDPGGMNTSVRDQALQRDTRHLAAHRLKAGQRDRLGRVVDDQIDAGEGLDRADVASLSADDPALHLVIGKRHDRNSRLCHLLGGKLLNGKRDDISRLFVCFFLELLLVFHDLHGLFVSQLVLQLGEQIVLCLFCGIARNFFEHLELAFLDRFDFFQLGVRFADLLLNLLVLFLNIVELAVEGLFLLLDTSLLTLHLTAAVGNLLLALIAEAVNLFFSLKNKLLLFCLTCLHCVSHNAPCLFLCGTDFFFGGIPADIHTGKNTGGNTGSKRCNDADNQNSCMNHLPDTSLFCDFYPNSIQSKNLLGAVTYY